MQLPGDNELILGDDKAILKLDINGLVQDCSNSIANALELLQSCTKPLISSQRMTTLYIDQVILGHIEPEFLLLSRWYFQ